MNVAMRYTIWRLLPVLMIVVAVAAWFNDVQAGGPFVARNLIPLLILILLAVVTLYKGKGRWAGSGWRLPLGLLGFAIPALGLGAYLHYAYAVNLNGMFTDLEYPFRVFRYLPIYTLIAGGIGFVIGWIVGRNV